jgi:hypothetical protein
VELGGKVGLRTEFSAIRKTGGEHDMSLLAGPFLSFYGGASIFLGFCADDIEKSLDGAPTEASTVASEVAECGKVAGASLELEFLNFFVGPKGWARMWPEARSGVAGMAFEVGVDVQGDLNVLKGKLSLWVHYLVPEFCWVRILGHRVFPYPCPPWFTCNTAGITIVSFPGFHWTLFDEELASMKSWVDASSAAVGHGCPDCPTGN